MDVAYARNGGVHIAYTVVGEGPVDLVYTNGIWSNLEALWEEPRWVRYAERLASFSRLIVFDMRGVGLSDRGTEPPFLELMMDDAGAVMDAAGSETAALFGAGRGGVSAMLFAATHPERVRALVLYDTWAKLLRSEDHPHGVTAEQDDAFIERFVAEMGSARNLDLQAPTGLGDERFVRWWARFERLITSPAGFEELAAVRRDTDVRAVLPAIHAPTLVLHRAGDRIVPVEQGRYLGETIPNATFVELAGDDHIPFVGDADAIVDEVQEFLTGARSAPETDRILATVLLTDIAGSTDRAAALGDRGWRELLERHHASVRSELERFRGVEIDNAGDGFMASFDGPARAIRCACAIEEATSQLGLDVKAGVHTGECERIGDKLGGIAVHIAARVAGAAAPGEVLVSQTVRDLVAGSGIEFDDKGAHELKGVPETWRLYSVRR